jgi:predicted acylesterase/phospholipase RssA
MDESSVAGPTGRCIRTVLVVVLAIVLRILPAEAQDALVLSGGGSRGIAHAGAIAGLETKGFSPTIVAGTSMGAIIGGLYASGMPIDSVIAITRRLNWLQIFAMPRVFAGRSFEPLRPLLQFGLFADPTRYAEGIMPDGRVNRLLAGLFFEAGARSRGDFNAMPRRFRAVSTDLRDGSAVVIEHGDLARAIRASMAVPGVFAPVLWDGVPLVDGGVADYMPVDAARAAGGRRIVAVDAIRPPPRVGGGPFRIALRAFRLTLQNARPDTPPPDVTIVPSLNPDFFAAIFVRDPLPLIEAGREAALDQSPTFDGGGSPSLPTATPTRFASLRIETNDSTVVPLTERIFGSIAPGPWDPAAVMRGVDRLYATGFVSGVWPSVEGPADAATLVVLAEAKPPSILSLTAGWDTDRSFGGWAGWSQRFAGTSVLGISVGAGAIEARASVDWTQTFEPRLALRAGAYWNRYTVRRFAGDEASSAHAIRRTGGSFALQWGGAVEPLEIVTAFEGERIEMPARAGNSFGPRLRILRDDAHARVVGTPARLDVEWRFGDIAYHRFGLAGSIDHTSGPFLAAVMADLSSAGGDPPEDVTPALGDDHAMPGLRWGRDRDRVRALTGIDLAVATPLEAFVRMRLRGGAVARSADRLGEVRWIGGADAGVVWWTPLGQFSLDAGVTTRGDWRLGVDIGPLF